MAFSKLTLLVETGDGQHFINREELRYTAENGEVIVVPAGSGSDGASTPRLIWRLIPPFGSYWLAAFLHDWLYRCSKLSKRRCDALLYEAMRSLGVGHVQAWEIYEGVHLGGQASFDEDRKAQAIAEMDIALAAANGVPAPVAA